MIRNALIVQQSIDQLLSLIRICAGQELSCLNIGRWHAPAIQIDTPHECGIINNLAGRDRFRGQNASPRNATGDPFL